MNVQFFNRTNLKQLLRVLFLVFFSSLTLVVSAQDNSSIQDGLKSGTVISGKIVDASSNKPICDAFVIETVENDTAAYYYTHSDEDGSFSFPLVGNGHVLKVYADGYEWIRIPLDKSTVNIKLKQAPDGSGRDGILYVLGHVDLYDMTPEGMKNRRSGSDIRILKQEDLTGTCYITGGPIE